MKFIFSYFWQQSGFLLEPLHLFWVQVLISHFIKNLVFSLLSLLFASLVEALTLQNLITWL
jgi:hypothetical protein